MLVIENVSYTEVLVVKKVLGVREVLLQKSVRYRIVLAVEVLAVGKCQVQGSVNFRQCQLYRSVSCWEVLVVEKCQLQKNVSLWEVLVIEKSKL